MLEPIVVIHGVANHEEAPFLTEVAELQTKIGSDRKLIPVFWGDLGGKSVDISDCLPKFADGQWQVRSLEAATPAQAEEEVRSQLGGKKAMSERVAVIASVAAPSSEEVRGGNDELSLAIAEALEQTAYLKFVDDERTLAAVGEAVRGVLDASQASQGEFEVRGWSVSDITGAVKGAIKKVISGVDSSVGRIVEDKLGVGNQQFRAKAMPWFSLFFGDIFTYQRNQADVQGRIWKALEKAAGERTIEVGYGTRDKPVHLAAHSLGGIVAFDAAVQPVDGRTLWMKSFTSFGSQAAFFQILDARQALGSYAHDHPLTLPPSIAKWNNLWHPLDILGFTAGTVFRLHDGSKPVDIPVSEPASHLFGEKLWAHSIYWHTEELVDILKSL
jgi:hypothetical protein